MGGPRAIRNKRKYLQKALEEKERETEIHKRETFSYESTTAAAQRYAREQYRTVLKDSGQERLEVGQCGSDGHLHGQQAITFWSDHLLSGSNDDSKSENDGKKSFAKQCSFTNDIRDGRLQHACK